MAIVWPCTLSVDAYAAAGKEVEVPRPDCPSCLEPMTFWSGYSRFVRHDGRAHKVWVARGLCSACAVTHALLPGFVAKNRLDSIETIGAALEPVVSGEDGVRPVAERLGVPHSTVRGWVRRFGRRAASLALSFAALAVELGGEAVTPRGDPRRDALAAMTVAWRAVTGLPGWLAVGPWRFCSSVCGATLVATNTNSPYLLVGRRRFMPPVG
jgi:transposase-like protein